MRLDTITNIEQFMTDALLSSPQIPLGVNVIRLAATTDEEGIAALARSIVVRYTGSSLTINQRQPLSIERTLKFEVIHSSQSYLSESGHDAALQMCAGAYLTLNNSIPVRSGTQIIVPFSMSSESFDGLTDSSHYVYVQNWEVTVQEINPTISMNPCVLYGNCRELFESYIGGELLPGDVVHNGNQLWSPVLPPFADEDYDPEYCGVVVKDNDLCYKHDPSQIFLTNWQDYKLVSTNTMDETGTFLIVNLYDEFDQYIDNYLYSNCDERRFLGIQSDLWKGQLSKMHLKGKNGLAWATEWPKTDVYLDPTDSDAEKVSVRYGFVMRIDLGVYLDVDGEKFFKVNSHLFSTGWIREGEFEEHVFRYDRLEDCDQDEAENEGPTECV